MIAESAEHIIKRISELSEKDAKLLEDRKTRLLAAKLLRLLPQGPGSGLNADLLDNMHAEDIIKKARILIGGGGGARDYQLEIHGNEHHEPDFATETHASQHENGGPDEIDVAGLSGVLAEPQVPIVHLIHGDSHMNDGKHGMQHQNGGADEISVAGLSGVLAEFQNIEATAFEPTKSINKLKAGTYLYDKVVGTELEIGWTGRLPIYRTTDDTTTQPLPTAWTDKLILELPWQIGFTMMIFGTIEISSNSTVKSCYARMIHTDYTGGTIRKICNTYTKEQKDVGDVTPVTFMDFITIQGYEDYIRIQIMSDSPADAGSYAKNCRLMAHRYQLLTAGF